MILKYTIRLIDHFLWRNLAFHHFKEYKKIPEILVVSPGGVATTMLIKHIRSFIKINCENDTDYLKHIPTIPKNFIKKKIKIIYIYDNKEVILNSLERRSYLTRQIIKLGGILEFFTNFFNKRNLCKKYIEYQINHFIKSEYPYLLILKYEDIWNEKKTIMKFIGISDLNFLNKFPEKRNRNL